MTLRKLSIVVSSSLALAACAGTYGQSTDQTVMAQSDVLTGSSWRLIEIRDLSNPSAGIKIDESEVYSLLFQAGARAALQLDCNRGFGTWSATSGHDGNSGDVSISSIGVTKAMCAPGSMSDRVTADLSRFARFTIEGDNLVTELSDGSAAYVWVPSADDSETHSE